MKLRFFAALIVAACGDDSSSENQAPPPGGDAAPPVCEPAPPPQKPAASCNVTVELPPISASNARHVPVGTPIAYCSNPPTTGEHYPQWADFKEYTSPVQWPYLVHSIEHGAVVLLYKCDGACPEIVDALRAARDRFRVDPRCPPGVRRIIIMPDPAIPTKVAAAAWGATYTADCVDGPTLDAFMNEHYAKTVEDICNAGKSF